MKNSHVLTRAEYAEYLRDRLRPDPGNPSYKCHACNSFHPDTTPCVDGTWKAYKEK